MNITHLRWTLARVSVMSWQERSFRIQEQMRRATYRPNKALKSIDLTPLQVEHFLSLADLKYCESQWQIISSGLKIYGFEWPETDAGIPEWYKFLSGRDTEQDKCFKLKFRNSEELQDDIKLVWEVNRLIWLIPIATFAQSTRNQEAGDYVLKVVKGYLESDRVGFGARWGSSIEAAYQALALMILSSILSPEFNDSGLHIALAQAVSARKSFMSRFPSLYSSANNHRLAELVALVIIEANSLADRQKLNKLSSELERRTLEQFDDEGMSSELSFDYQLSSLDLLLATREFVDPKFLTQKFMDRVQMASGTTAEIYKFSKVWPNIGDADQASLLSSVVTRAETAEWIGRFAGVETVENESNVRTFSKSGYSLLKTGIGESELFLVVDHGTIGFAKIAAHGHADTLGIWVWLDQTSWLIEAGTYSYHSTDKFRNFLRSSKMHNTISIDNKSTSKPSGPFLWFEKNRAIGRLNSIFQKGKGFEVDLEATTPAPSSGRSADIIRRYLTLDGSRLRVTDRVEAQKNSSFTSHFILDPRFELKRGINRSEITLIDLRRNEVTFQFDPNVTDLRFDRVKISKSYGHLEETYRISFESVASKKVTEQSVTIMFSPSGS